MTKIVGHRGAAGLALENTIASIERARSFDVDAIEIDVRLTKDRHLVLSHDEHLARVSLLDTVLAEINLEDIVDIHLTDDHTLPSLRQALKACKDTPVIVELKDLHSADVLVNISKDFPKLRITATSFHLSEIKRIRKLAPDMPVFIAEHFSPTEIIASARSIGAHGITLNAWLLNPLTYWLAQRYNLQIMVYTVNHRFIGNFLRRLYPRILICTDRPDVFIRKRRFKELAKKLQRTQQLTRK